MEREHICDVLLFTLISLACGADKCIFETKRPKHILQHVAWIANHLKCLCSGKKNACCADYEEKENGCVACSKGYTSDQGQICRPCEKYTYGEKCAYDCHCSALEICNIVEGCIISTEMSEHDTPNTTNLPWILDETTTKKSTEISKGLLSRDIISYYTLSLTVAVYGICVCFIIYNRKRRSEKKKSTITKTTNRALPQNCHIIEIEEPMYDIIDDTDIQQIQMQKPHEFNDVISRSNSTGSTESQKNVNLELSCQFLPNGGGKRHDSNENSSPVIMDDNISSSFEDIQNHTQTFLTDIEIATPKVTDTKSTCDTK